MSDNRNKNSWFEIKNKTLDGVCTAPNLVNNQWQNNKSSFCISKPNFYKHKFNQRNAITAQNKNINPYKKDTQYLQIDKSNGWNMQNQRPYRDDRVKTEKHGHSQFYFILGKFYQRKKSVKYRDMKWNQLKAIEKQKEADYLLEIRSKIENIKKNMEQFTKDELIEAKDEVLSYIKKFSLKDKVTRSVIAQCLVEKNKMKYVYFDKYEEETNNNMNKGKIEEKMEIEREVETEQIQIFQDEESEKYSEVDDTLCEYFQLTQPDLLQEDYYKIYVETFLESAVLLSEKNSAPIDVEIDIIDFVRLKEIKMLKEKKWAKKDEDIFRKEMKNKTKNFLQMQFLLGKNIKDIVLHYYRNKKKVNFFNKRKGGRMSDDEMKSIIAREWDTRSIDTFVSLFSIHGRSWEMYTTKFPRKTTKDFKLIYRYLNKYENYRLERRRQRPNTNQNETNNKYKNEFTISERQVFAMYYPFIGRNWLEMSQVCNRTINEVRGYYRHYYKKLSTAEKKFETMMKEYDRDVLSCFKRVFNIENEKYSRRCGILFLARRHK